VRKELSKLIYQRDSKIVSRMILI